MFTCYFCRGLSFIWHSFIPQRHKYLFTVLTDVYHMVLSPESKKGERSLLFSAEEPQQE